VGRLVKFVRETDKIIKLFNHIKKPLIVMGNGPDELALKAMANDNIIFVGWIDDLQERMDIMKKAK
jgi:glycosyltransferase involved in cell wall biosynthesis